MTDAYMPQSKRIDWCTPKSFFQKLNKIYNFNLDAAASAGNRLCGDKYFDEQNSGLSNPWSGMRVWCNPPYGRALTLWIEKAILEMSCADKPPVIVMLIPARTDTRWWHAAIESGARAYYIKGRLKFDDGAMAAPFPSALLIWEDMP